MVNVVSFSATRAGLAKQLLSTVIECKLPQVEERRRTLLKEEESLKLKLTELEDSLLSELANSQGNILENSELRNSLNNTKTSSDTVKKNLEESAKVKETLERDQAIFLVLANKCCNVYFALQTLPKLNTLYRFSLQTFVEIYRTAVETLAKNDQVKEQLQKFCALAFYQVIHYVYVHVSRAVFKTDRLTFLLQLIRYARPELIKKEEWQFLLNSELQDSTVLNDTASGDAEKSPVVFSWLDSISQIRVKQLLRKMPTLLPAVTSGDTTGWKDFVGTLC